MIKDVLKFAYAASKFKLKIRNIFLNYISAKTIILSVWGFKHQYFQHFLLCYSY